LSPLARSGPERGALDGEHIEVAIVVVVEQRAARTGDFGKQQFSRGPVVVDEVETGLSRDVNEES
jgi:hypothetical protein